MNINGKKIQAYSIPLSTRWIHLMLEWMLLISQKPDWDLIPVWKNVAIILHFVLNIVR